jgi:hypothetical protein
MICHICKQDTVDRLNGSSILHCSTCHIDFSTEAISELLLFNLDLENAYMGGRRSFHESIANPYNFEDMNLLFHKWEEGYTYEDEKAAKEESLSSSAENIKKLGLDLHSLQKEVSKVSETNNLYRNYIDSSVYRYGLFRIRYPFFGRKRKLFDLIIKMDAEYHDLLREIDGI